MNRTCHAAVAVATLAINATALYANEAALPVEIAPSSSKIHCAGRFDTRDAKGPRCAWSACAMIDPNFIRRDARDRLAANMPTGRLGGVLTSRGRPQSDLHV